MHAIKKKPSLKLHALMKDDLELTKRNTIET